MSKSSKWGPQSKNAGNIDQLGQYVLSIFVCESRVNIDLISMQLL